MLLLESCINEYLLIEIFSGCSLGEIVQSSCFLPSTLPTIWLLLIILTTFCKRTVHVTLESTDMVAHALPSYNRDSDKIYINILYSIWYPYCLTVYGLSDVVMRILGKVSLLKYGAISSNASSWLTLQNKLKIIIMYINSRQHKGLLLKELI